MTPPTLSEWGHCPVCNHDQFEGDSWELDGLIVSQVVWCLNCDSEWTDQYQAIGRHNLAAKEPLKT